MVVANSAVILARVSSKAQEDEGYSLDSQLKLLHGYCDNKGLIVTKIFKIAETASKQQSRKVFQDLLDYISKNNVQHLAVEKTDRLTRNLRDAVLVDDWLEQDASRNLHAVKENLLLHKESKSDVKFMWNIHLAVAKKYTDNLREEAMKGWAEKLAQGWLPSVPPPGYKTVLHHGKRIHVPDPLTMESMREVFRLYLSPSHSIASICEEMDRMGLVTRSGRPYVKSNVQKILNNPFYIGINHFMGKDHPGAQEKLITPELWHAVQAKMHKGRPVVLAKHDVVYRNFFTCENCNKAFSWQLQKPCKGKKYLREDQVTLLFKGMLKELVCPSPAVVEWMMDELKNTSQNEVNNRDEMIAALRLKLQRLTRMDEELYDDKLSGEITKDRYLPKHEQFMTEKQLAKDSLAKLEATDTLQSKRAMTVLELSQNASEIYDGITNDEKRAILIELFSNMTADGNSVSVTLTDFARSIMRKSRETKLSIRRTLNE
jgi:site-specific DNA recombinase